MKRLGPELKMPKRGDIKVPRIVSDLYWDLRDRHLLPLVALLIVAIIAAPILLGSSNSSGPKVVPTISGEGGSTEGSQLTVVAAEPGLRSPKKRFAHRRPTNPFKQRFTGPQVANAEANAVEHVETTTPESEASSSVAPPINEVTIEESTVTPLPESTPAPSPTSPSGPSERGGGGPGSESSPGETGPGSEPAPGELRYFGYSATVQIAHTEQTEDGKTELSEPEVRQSIKPLAVLPGDKKPVVTFIGLNTATEKALFVVSKEVTAIFGEANCVSGTSSCDLVELEKGMPVTFDYGPEAQRWKIKLISTKLYWIKDPSKAKKASSRSVGGAQAVVGH